MLDPLLYQRFVQEARQALALYEQDALLSYVPKKSLVEELAAPLQLSEDQKAKGCLLVIRKYILRAIWAGLKHPGARIEWAWRKPITASLPDFLAFMETLHPETAVKEGPCFAPEDQDLQAVWYAGGVDVLNAFQAVLSKARVLDRFVQASVQAGHYALKRHHKPPAKRQKVVAMEK